MSQTTIQTASETTAASSLIPPQRTVEREASTGTTSRSPRPEPPALPARRSALRALGALLRRGASSAEQVEHAAAAAAWARQRPVDGHHDPLMRYQPLVRGLR